MTSIIISILLLILGLVILIGGAEFLVRGASSISKKAGIPPIVIGLTIVAFGTSAPELVVNVFSALKGNTDLAVGNIIGSNISNILLILGISALIIPLKVQKSTTWKEIPFAMLSVIILFLVANDVILDDRAINQISRIDGIIFLGFFGMFMYYTFELFRKNHVKKGFSPEEANVEEEIIVYNTPLSILMTLSGLAGLFLGGRLLVNNAVSLATLAGLSEMFIGLTVVAIGTSLPELATSIIACRKGQSDIAIGNVVGSNIFNVFWILGVTSVITPIPINPGANFDIIVSLVATLILFLAMFTGKRHQLDRWQGALLLILYVLYMHYVIVRG